MTVIAKETVRIGYVMAFQTVFESVANSSLSTDKPSTRRIPTPELRRHAWLMVGSMVSEGFELYLCLSCLMSGPKFEQGRTAYTYRLKWKCETNFGRIER